MALIQEQELSAYGLVAELQRLFGPAYQPSPGAVYPALKALTAERLLAKVQDGRSTRYRLTAPGQEALQRRRRQLAAIERRTEVDVQGEALLQRALNDLEQAVRSASGRRVDASAIAALVDGTRRRISALGNKEAG